MNFQFVAPCQQNVSHTDSRTCGLADSWTRGLADLQTCGLVDLQTRGLVDLQTCGLTYVFRPITFNASFRLNEDS
jgi:hypothetical protein